MPRQKKIDRPVSLELSLPSSVKTRLEQALFSELEGKIPFGAFSKLGEKLFVEWLDKRDDCYVLLSDGD